MSPRREGVHRPEPHGQGSYTASGGRPKRWWMLADLALAARMSGISAAAWVMVRTTTLPRAMRWLDPGLGPGPARAGVLDRHLRVATGLFRDVRRRIGSNCMRRSLVLFRCLRREGFPVAIVFGVKRNGDGGLDGHAWIEIDSRPILEPGEPREEFAVAFVYPPP